MATALAIISGIPYTLSIARGQTKPHQFTFFIWTIMNFVVFTTQFLEGARASIAITGVFCFLTTINLVLSFKHGVRGTSRYDKLLLSLALATIAIWLLTRNNVLAIWLTILIDIPATTMLVLKLRKHPGSEPLRLWAISAVAGMFTCLSLADKAFGILYVRPIYTLLSTLAVVLAIIYFARAIKKRIEPRPTIPQAEEY